MANKVLEVKDLVTTFRIEKKEYEVLRGVSFDLHENETLCMVGESGCGKSVTTLAVMDLLPNNGRVVSGSIKLNGKELIGMPKKERNTLRGKQMGMIFQEPMTALNPLLTIGRQMTEALMLHQGLSKKEARQVAIDYLNKNSKCPICGEPSEIRLGEPRQDKLCPCHAAMLRDDQIALCKYCGSWYNTSETCKCRKLD